MAVQAWAQDSLSGAALPWALWAIRGSAASAAGGRHMLATRFMSHAAMFPWGVGDAGRFDAGGVSWQEMFLLQPLQTFLEWFTWRDLLKVPGCNSHSLDLSLLSTLRLLGKSLQQ